ncbi:MAG TPA: TIGR02302 family protein [Roseiarcus sp.]
MAADERTGAFHRNARPGAGAGFDALARRAEAVLLFERIWPALAWAGAAVALFLAVSWLGVWFVSPRAARVAGVVLFAVLLFAALAPLAWLRRPTREETLARVDRDAHAPHRPAASFDDRLAAQADDPATRALWDLHRRRLAEEVQRIPPASPSPRMVLRDPRALRFGVVLLAVCAGLVAGPERYARLAAAFDWRGSTTALAAARLDAWIDPPPYTGKPPILIDVATRDPAARTIVTPEGSVLVVRADPREIDTQVHGGLAPVTNDKPAPTAPGPVERRWTVRGDGGFTVRRDGSALGSFSISSIPSGKPTISLLEPPRPNISGSLTLHYSVADRYGVASAEAEFAAKPAGADAKPAPRALMEAPKLPLQLPSTVSGAGEASTTSDLAQHPWAGAEVIMTLKATGLSGAVGASAPVTITLPQRDFHNPLARALVEQRRKLILDPDHDPPHLAKAVGALMIAPDVFGVSAGVYLGLRTVKARVDDARSDADLIAVADLLWTMAVQIEDGDASQAQRDLRAAEQRLREALQRGASDDEIRKLTKELRDAAERYMRDLAQQNPNAEPDANGSPMEQKDLESMLDRLEDTARNGAREDAQAMLDQLQNMFENMRGARQADQDPTSRELRKQLSELEKLLHDQQGLRDETFRRDQRERMRRDGRNEDGSQQPQAGEGDQQDGQPSLEQRQRALRDRLAELQRRLKTLGMKGEKGFDDAQGDMKEAEGDLNGDGEGQGQGQKPGDTPGEGDADGGAPTGKGKAVDAQGRALQALRDGAQGLQQQMQGGGDGQGYAATGRRPGDPRQGRDPLGRESGDQRGATEGVLNGGPDVAARARRVLEELRRRLSDPNRPTDERDYLERLLRRD